MEMRQTPQILALVGAVVASGCATHHQACHPSHDERAVFAITALYEDTRALTTTNGVQRYVLVPEAPLVESAESMLMHYSQSEEPIVRGAAGCRLAQFGTKAALRRALELAHAEVSPEIRADIWSALAELLQSPLMCPIPDIKTIAGSSGASTDTNLAQIPSSPDLRCVISCCQKPADFILPLDVPAEAIETEIIKQYATDTGTWSVAVVDRIPFIPFSAHHRTLTLTVRQSIADALHSSARDNKRILAAFRDFARDDNEAISRPARQVMEALGHSAGSDADVSKENRTNH
jgi:hypothetical protein